MHKKLWVQRDKPLEKGQEKNTEKEWKDTHRLAKIRERQGGANVATEMGGQEVGSTCDDKGWENGGSNLLYEEW